jgi:hypothetical protein
MAVDVATMAEANDHDYQNIVTNLVDDSMVADTNTIQVIETSQSLAARRSWVVRKGADSVIDAVAKGLGNIAQLAHGAFREFYGVAHLLTVQAEFPFYNVVGNGAFARHFGKGLGGLFTVDAIFALFKVRFEQSEVGDGDDRGQRLAVVFEQDGLAVLDVLDGVRKIIVRAVKHSLCHGHGSSLLIIAGIG